MEAPLPPSSRFEAPLPPSPSWQGQQRRREDDDATSDAGDMHVSDVMVDNLEEERGRSRPRAVGQSDQRRRCMLEFKTLEPKHPYEFDEKPATVLPGSLVAEAT